MENKKATQLGTRIFFHNKEMMSQCNDQSTEPITVEYLVIHFDQEKFEELLSRGDPTLHTQKYRKASVAKSIPVTDQKAAPTEAMSNPMPGACPVKRALLQFPSASTEAKLTSCKHGGLGKAK